MNLIDLERLGIDEIALRKGQGSYVVVLVDLDSKDLVGMVESRRHKDIKLVLKGWGTEVLSRVKEVSIDMSGNYRGLVKKMMPNADIVADRFHVMKLVNGELNRARHVDRRAIKEIKDEDKKQELEAILKNSKYALLKPKEALTELQQEKLISVQKSFPNLAKMYEKKEALRTIFEEAKDWTNGVLGMLDWLKDVQDIFKDSAATIGRWFEKITNYFLSRTTSGAVEGINNRLKLIKRSGYGFRNFENFRLRCMMRWHVAIG